MKPDVHAGKISSPPRTPSSPSFLKPTPGRLKKILSLGGLGVLGGLKFS
jgi:hypothetical protein